MQHIYNNEFDFKQISDFYFFPFEKKMKRKSYFYRILIIKINKIKAVAVIF